MMREKTKKIYLSQHGFVSIIVVSILTVTLALIAIGFSKLADRELRQASDRESSAEAYYAAQSGINDAIAYIQAGGTGFQGCTVPNTPPVGSSVNPKNYFTTDLSGGSNIARYSCISVDNAPQLLSNTVTPGQPWIVKVDASNLNNLFIGWENSSYDTTPPNPPLTWLSPYGSLPNEVNFPVNTTGVLRTQIYSVGRGDLSDTNSNLAAGSRAYYLYPDSGSGTVHCPNNPAQGCVAYGAGNYSTVSGPSGNNGTFVSGQCKDLPTRPDPSGNNLGSPTYCNSAISGLHGNMNFYYLYFTAQYAPLKVVIQGTGTGAVGFTGAQAVIDVTGQAADQIQRVRARVGLTAQFNEPNYAVQSMETLCKAFVLQILPNQKYTVAPTAGASNDPSCVAPPVGVSNNIFSSPSDKKGH